MSRCRRARFYKRPRRARTRSRVSFAKPRPALRTSPISENARVLAIDADEAAVGALARAAKAPGLKPVEATTRDLFRRPLAAAEFKGFDAVVLDPPRQGAEAEARALARAAVPRAIYVSCDPASFARDARILCQGGYRLAGVTPVDQFRYSAHVELVGVFER